MKQEFFECAGVLKQFPVPPIVPSIGDRIIIDPSTTNIELAANYKNYVFEYTGKGSFLGWEPIAPNQFMRALVAEQYVTPVEDSRVYLLQFKDFNIGWIQILTDLERA